MDQLKDLLKNNSPPEPPQVKILKDYLAKNYEIETSVVVSNNSYLIFAPNAALAHKLRVGSLEISAECNLDKKLIIRIRS